MAASIRKATKLNILVMLLLMFVIILNIIYSDKGPLMENTASTTFMCIKSQSVNLINNFACRKQKLSNQSILFPVGTHGIHKQNTLILLLILSGDIECNLGPKNASVFPCGYCECPVTWSRCLLWWMWCMASQVVWWYKYKKDGVFRAIQRSLALL